MIKNKAAFETGFAAGANGDTRFKTFPGIDLVKFLCAILVISIHVPPIGENVFPSAWVINYGIQQYIARIAVPFFFACTGFLVFRRTTPEHFSFAVGFSHVRKTCRLYLSWTALYLPLIIRNILHCEGSIRYGISLFVRDFIFTGSYFHLWYLPAAAFSVLLISGLLYKKVKLSLIIGSAFVLYCIGLLSQSWHGLVWNYRAWPLIPLAVDALSQTMVTARNGLFDAYLFVGLGMLVAYRPVRLSASKAAAGFVCSMALLFAEVAVLTKAGWIREHDMYLFLIPASYFLLLFASRVRFKQRRLYPFLRKTSSLIFFTHVGIDQLVCIAYEDAGADVSASVFRFVIVFAASLLLSLLVVYMSERPRFKRLKKLYS